MGIDQPLKSASLAPAATCRSWRGEVRGLTEGTLSGPLRSSGAADDHRHRPPAREADRRRRRRRRRQGPRRAAAHTRRRGGRPAARRPAAARPGRPRRPRRARTRSPGCPPSARARSRSSPSPASARPTPPAPTAPRRCAAPPVPPAARWADAARWSACSPPSAGTPDAERLHAVGEGVAARRLRVHRLQVRPAAPTAWPRRATFTIVVPGAAEAETALRRVRAVADAVALVRDLVNTPPNDLYPAELAARGAAAGEKAGLTAEILDEDALAAGGYGGILAVGSGSTRKPRLLRLTYTGSGARKKIALVGKGITFDSGGLSIKPAAEDGGHEERHGRRRRRDRHRVPRRPARPAGRGHRHRARSPRTCPAAPPTGRPTWSPSATARRPRSPTPTPRAAWSWPTRSPAPPRTVPTSCWRPRR